VNAKGTALLLRAVLESPSRVATLAGPARLADLALASLFASAKAVGTGLGWGYPFDWRSRLFIPRGTPNVVVSTAVGHALRLHWLRTGDTRTRDMAHAVSIFIRESLLRSNKGDRWIAYTPLDRFQVHNASLMGAAYVAQDAVDYGDGDALKLALEVTEFSLRDVLPDGTLNYWSTEQAGGVRQQDTYHSGFEIRALLTIAAISGRADIAHAARRYAQTWLADFVPVTGEVAHTRGSRGQLEVHSVAEAMLTLASLATHGVLTATDLSDRLSAVMTASADRLWRSTAADCGYYAWKARLGPLGWRKTDIPLIRWGVGWMLLAHAVTLSQLEQPHSATHP
jgi:hypothetical protein